MLLTQEISLTNWSWQLPNRGPQAQANFRKCLCVSVQNSPKCQEICCVYGLRIRSPGLQSSQVYAYAAGILLADGKHRVSIESDCQSAICDRQVSGPYTIAFSLLAWRFFFLGGSVFPGLPDRANKSDDPT